ncbi:MAG: hypothetical protein WEE36_09710 [Acidimicrobiia bacterium]
MRRLPNPWVGVPALLAGIAGGIVAFIVTEASCAPGSCAAVASISAVVVGLGIAAGVGVVAVLALKSIDEHRTHRERMVLTMIEGDTRPEEPRE